MILLILTHLLAAVVGVVLAVAYSRKEIAKAQAKAAGIIAMQRRQYRDLADAIRIGEGA